MLVHFDASGERAFTFGENSAAELRAIGGSINRTRLNYNAQLLHRYTSSVETFEDLDDAEILKRLNQYSESNLAQLVRNAVEIFPINPEASNMILDKLYESYCSQNVDTYHLFSQLIRNRSVFDLFQGSNWRIANLPNWEPYRKHLEKQYPFIHCRRASDCWTALQDPIVADEDELFARGRQKNFFVTLLNVAKNETDLNSAFLDYCGLVGNLPREEGSLENHFFGAFSFLTPEIETRKKSYYIANQKKAQLARKNVDTLSDYINESNILREALEESLAVLARKITAEGLRRGGTSKSEEAEKRKLENILAEWNNVFHLACLNTSKALQNYFQPRHRIKPRITIKAIDLENNDLTIRTIFRDHKASYQQSSRLDNNTGFQFSLRTGQPFICNNVPASYEAGIYTNPRLKSLGSVEQRKIHEKIGSHKGWVSLWQGGLDKEPSGSYKSTLIVPINISRASKQPTLGHKVSREAMTAFLCIDHEIEDYFDPKTDMRVMENGASIFRTYLSTRHSVLVSTRIILKLVERLKGKFTTIQIQSMHESKTIKVSQLEHSIVKADSTSSLSFIDYGLRHVTDESEG